MMSLLILFFLVSIVFSFLCSLWEAVLLSVTPAYSRVQEDKGTAIGRQLRVFKDNIDKPLAAILTLNTIAHTAGAIGVDLIWVVHQGAIIVFVFNPIFVGVSPCFTSIANAIIVFIQLIWIGTRN